MSTLRYDPAHRPRTHGPGPCDSAGAGRRAGSGRARLGDAAGVLTRRRRSCRSWCRRRTRRRACRNWSRRSPGHCDLREAGGPRRLAGFEIIVVDDASTDRTPAVLRGLAADYPELRVLVLADGVGQSSATLAGIRAARGDWIATLDADLQNDPADLVRLWEALPGHDAALGWRVERQDVWSRRVISRWANRVRNGVLGQSIRDTGCSVRIFPREVALRLPAFRGVHRFFGPLLLREGCRLVQVPVGHRPRPHGRSHYNLWNRSIQVVVDLLGVAWLLRRPLRYRVVQAWDAREAADRRRAERRV